MPKMKTNKAAKKRFKVTPSGKVLRRKAGISHFLEHESPKEKRSREGLIELDKTDLRKVNTMLPYKNK